MNKLDDIGLVLEKKYPKIKDMFVGKKNEWIKRHSNVMKGKIGEEMVMSYIGAKKSKVLYEYDLVLDDKNIEVKLSCLNETGYFKWLNIRIDDNYTHICLIGIYPEKIEMFLVPKEELEDHLKVSARGKRGDGKIMYIGLKPKDIWLEDFKI